MDRQEVKRHFAYRVRKVSARRRFSEWQIVQYDGPDFDLHLQTITSCHLMPNSTWLKGGSRMTFAERERPRQ